MIRSGNTLIGGDGLRNMRPPIPSVITTVLSLSDDEQDPYQERVVCPSSIDVMCGTGHEKKHPGNELFKLILSQYIPNYSEAQSKKAKMQITKTILVRLNASGVRFLKKSSVYQYWYVAEPKVARDKIGHFLRLHLPKQKSSSLKALEARCTANDARLSSPSIHSKSSLLASTSDKSVGANQGMISSSEFESLSHTISTQLNQFHSAHPPFGSGNRGFDSGMEKRQIKERPPDSPSSPLALNGELNPKRRCNQLTFSKMKLDPSWIASSNGLANEQTFQPFKKATVDLVAESSLVDVHKMDMMKCPTKAYGRHATFDRLLNTDGTSVASNNTEWSRVSSSSACSSLTDIMEQFELDASSDSTSTGVDDLFDDYDLELRLD